MRGLPGCPEQITENSRYDCRLLRAQRYGGEEEICFLCPDLREKMEATPLLKKAVEFAFVAHRGQFRKGTKIPYMIHLFRTWFYVQQMTEDREEWAAAILHDTLEDTAVSYGELQKEFGRRVADLVQGESEEKRAGRPPEVTWQIRKTETILRLRQWAGEERRVPEMHIAFGDKLANLYSMMFEYRYAGECLWNKFNQKEKEKHAWYYGELGCVFSSFFCDGPEKLLVEEYWMYYKEVFGRYEISGEGRDEYGLL